MWTACSPRPPPAPPLLFIRIFRYFWDAENLRKQHYYAPAGIDDNIGSAMRRHFYYYNIMDGNLFEG